MIAAALGVATASYLPWQSLTAMPAPSAGEPAVPPRTVSVEYPAPAASATVVLPATLRAWQTTAIYARADGYLKAWHSDLGEHVKAGDLLAEIETPELDQEVVQAQALAREAAAAVVQARAERDEAEADLKVAQAQLARVEAETALAESQLVRRERLLARQAVSQEEYETTQRQLEARKADVAAAQSDVARRRAVLATRAAMIEVREAAAGSRQANVERLRELQHFQRIVAPFDGVVTRRTAEVGMLVTAGTQSLFLVEDTRRIRAQVNVPQMYALQAVPGAAVSVSLPESAASAVTASITRVADSVDPATRTMLAEIELDNAGLDFQPGSYAQVSLTAGHDPGAWTIPTSTLSMRVAGPHVAVVGTQGQIEVRRVRLGRDLGKRVVVAEGIRGDERLVVNPVDDLVDGLRVEVRQERADATEVAGR